MLQKILVLLLFVPCCVQAQWNYVGLPTDFPMNHTLKEIIYSSPETVWARYATWESPTYKSVTGGNSFSVINNLALAALTPINDSVIYALSWYGKLLKSIDGAFTFNEMPIISENSDTGFIGNKIIDMYFYNEANGWVMGNDTSSGCIEVWVTNNGAITWEKVPCQDIQISKLPFDNDFKSNNQVKRERFDEELIFKDHRPKLSNWSFNHFIRIRNFGRKWESFLVDTSVVPADKMKYKLAFAFIDSLTGIVVTDYTDSSMALTTDGGVVWKKIKNVPISYITKLEYAKPTPDKPGFLFVANLQGAYISYDTAKTWLFLDYEIHSNITFYDAERGISMTQPTSSQTGMIRVFNGRVPKPVGLSDLSVGNNPHIEIYPNPAQNQLTLELPNSEQYTKVVVSNIQGQTELSYQLSDDEKQLIHLNTLVNGVYFLSVYHLDGEILRTKFVVNK